MEINRLSLKVFCPHCGSNDLMVLIQNSGGKIPLSLALECRIKCLGCKAKLKLDECQVTLA